MISVRLSEDEYIALRRLCAVTGARSVSDLTRDAMQVLLRNAPSQNMLTSHLDEFRAQINKLDRKIEDLAKQVGSSKMEMDS